MFEIKNLTKTFFTRNGAVVALNDVSTAIHTGDIFGIMGMSGAGKSTLLRCLCLLEEPTKGQILLDGKDLAHLSGRELLAARRQMGVVFQGYNLLMQKTVAQNIAFPLLLEQRPGPEVTERVNELLSLVGLGDRADSYPSQLSGGQKQRVALARALATNPKILLCDEPTSALDPLTTKSVLELLQDINRKLGVTIIIITHEIGVVRSICNRMVVIDNGRFVEQGDTKTIFEHPQSDTARLLLGREE
ncbi:MAG: ATP-binding cassette domain-containing protein [Candidatus Fournierella pullistercoris]|uniref:ATP-binding cassette domain-containing protein n=1 Tax=Candidatus Allofournierella pullistercoris TaxID=2838597 RepID=A0A948T2V8_9FIRM|nr:ATP-binding cassette domain-containing protein [Candidatus Fournierella pullistercoris]